MIPTVDARRDIVASMIVAVGGYSCILAELGDYQPVMQPVGRVFRAQLHSPFHASAILPPPGTKQSLWRFNRKDEDCLIRVESAVAHDSKLVTSVTP